MRNLIAFVLRYQSVMLFVLLEVVSLFLFITNSSYQRAAFFNSANAYAGTMLTRRTEVADYFRLNELNQELLAENTRLRQQLFPPDFAHREADSLPVGRDTLGQVVYRHLRPYPAAPGRPIAGGLPTAGRLPAPGRPVAAARYPDSLLLGSTRLPTHDADYPMVPARVVNNALRNVDNYLTLNVGAADGVTAGLGVLAPAGVVGRVKSVSQHYATVTSLLHSKTAVAARLKRDGTFGSLRWEGDDYRFAQLDYIPRQNKLVRGDTVVTSGYNAVFPPGVFIGTVASFVKEPDKNFWTVQVQLGVDFSRLTYVYVVHNRPGAERDSLETALTQDPTLPKTKPTAKPATAGRPATPPAPVHYVPQSGLESREAVARREGYEQAHAEFAAKAAAEAKARAAAEKLAKAKAAAEAKAKAAAAKATPPLAPTTPTPNGPPQR